MHEPIADDGSEMSSNSERSERAESPSIDNPRPVFGASPLPLARLFAGPSTNDKPLLWLRRADQFILGVVLISLLVLLVAFRWKLSGGGLSEIEIASQQPREYFYSININQATWVEWSQLDGIGEKLAKRIVEDRRDSGPFQSVDDLKRVRGLRSKLIEKLRPFLICPAEESTESH
jgi:competence ComEA-like helix-hairpin-helix protein